MADRKRIRFELPRLAESLAPQVALTSLRALGWSARLRPSLRDELEWVGADRSKHELSFSINFRTADREHQVWIRVESRRIRAGPGELDDADATVELEDDTQLRSFLNQGHEPSLTSWAARPGFRCFGQLSCVAKFAHIAGASHVGNGPSRRRGRWPSDPPRDGELQLVQRTGSPRAFGAPSGVRYVRDPSFAEWSLADFPRLERGLRRLLGARPTISTQRALAITVAASAKDDGKAPVILARARRLAEALRRKPVVVREDDVVLGSTTEHVVGVPVYPELSHLLIWPELLTLETREHAPLQISREDYDLLNRTVFPFWMGRNVVDVASELSADQPILGHLSGARPLQLGEHNGLSATIPDLQTVLAQGLEALADEARDVQSMADPPQAAFHQAVHVALRAVVSYAERLSDAAEAEARNTDDPARRQELMETALSCRRSPARPAETLLDALNAVRICVAALHEESFDDGLSLGRLDLLLQPFLERELQRAKTPQARDEVVRRAVERVGCLLLSLADHVPLHAAAVERSRAGCRARQAVTVGGLHPDGRSATCEMTYVILKAAELLGLADPRIHVRYDPRTTPDYLLRRACEVALVTGGGPSIHNDPTVISALESLGIAAPRARDWAVTATHTPVVAGEHLISPDAATIDLGAALLLALHDGEHPSLPGFRGPHTGAAPRLESLPDLLEALTQQFAALLDEAAACSARIERALERVAPQPLLSTLLLGTQESGLDVTRGGARYQHFSVAVVGFVDVVDSICAIDEHVFQRKSLELDTLLSAMTEDFLGNPTLHDVIRNDSPRFGDGGERALTIAHQVAAKLHDAIRERKSRRGGRWIASYGALTSHFAFGGETGATPNGRRAGDPFLLSTCPALSSGSPAARIRHAASLRSRNMAGGSVFEAVVPGGDLEHAAHVDRLVTHTRTFLHHGGMHVQLATVDADTLQQADDDPAAYRDLLVSVAGYDAYFIELPTSIRVRLVRDAERAAGSHAPTGTTIPPLPVDQD